MNDFQRCLIDLDVKMVIGLWPVLHPGSPAPKNEYQGLLVLHYARTAAESIALEHRTYSHVWLTERGIPSGLPDHLKPKADRIYPRIVEAVGVSVKSLSGRSQQFAKMVERAMSDAVAEAYADGKRDPEFVKARMEEARARATRYAQ